MLLFLSDFEWFWGGPTWAKVCEGSQKTRFSRFGKKSILGTILSTFWGAFSFQLWILSEQKSSNKMFNKWCFSKVKQVPIRRSGCSRTARLARAFLRQETVARAIVEAIVRAIVRKVVRAIAPATFRAIVRATCRTIASTNVRTLDSVIVRSLLLSIVRALVWKYLFRCVFFELMFHVQGWLEDDLTRPGQRPGEYRLG